MASRYCNLQRQVYAQRNGAFSRATPEDAPSPSSNDVSWIDWKNENEFRGLPNEELEMLVGDASEVSKRRKEGDDADAKKKEACWLWKSSFT